MYGVSQTYLNPDHHNSSLFQNYDDEKAFNDMVKLGIFKSYNAKGQPNPEVFE